MQVATVAVIAEHKIAAAISGENPRTSRFMDDPKPLWNVTNLPLPRICFFPTVTPMKLS